MKSVFKTWLFVLVAFLIYGCSDDKEMIYYSDGANLATMKTGDVKTNLGALLVIENNEIVNDGGATLLQKGICFSVNDDPKITIENTSGYSVSSGAREVGTYTDTIKGLNPQTKYYYCSYAYTGKGIAYGDVKEAITNAIPTVDGSLQSTMFGDTWDVVVEALPQVGYYKALDMYEEGYGVVITVVNNVATVAKQPIGTHTTYGVISAAGSGPVVNGKVFNLTLTFSVNAGSFGAKAETLTLK